MRVPNPLVIALGTIAAVACTLGARDESELSGGGAKGGASSGGASSGGASTGGATTGGTTGGGTGGTAAGGAPTGGAAGSGGTSAGGTSAGGTAAGGTAAGGTGAVGGAAGAGGGGGTGGGNDACVSVPEICGDALDNDCDGTIDNGCSGLGTFVSEYTGNDANPGTKASPVKTIAKGMANATTIGGGVDVYIAEGHYPEKVTLIEGVSLLGGHQCTASSCTWANNPAAYDAAILATDAEGVLAGASITQATVVDGLRLMGQDGAATGNGRAAITLSGGTPKLTRNKIYGPSVTGGTFFSGRSIGVVLSGASNASTGALIQLNEIKGGTAETGSIGVLLEAAANQPGPTAKILQNTIGGGSGGWSFGINAMNSSAGSLAEGNDISGGTSSNGQAFGVAISKTLDVNANRINTGTSVATCPASATNTVCGGIASFSGAGSITNNVVFGANAPNSAALYLIEAEVASGILIVNANVLNGGGTAGNSTRSAAFYLRIGACGTCGLNGINGRVRNNILQAGKAPNAYGVYEDAPSGKTTHPQALQNNLFFVGTGVLYREFDGTAGTNLASIAAVNALSVIPSVGANIVGDPLLGATWHIGAASPCINKGTLTEAPAKDMDGEARPKGAAIDIGADEAQ